MTQTPNDFRPMLSTYGEPTESSALDMPAWAKVVRVVLTGRPSNRF